jgi:hypothetical protein
MSKERSKEDLRFFKVELEFESKGTLKAIVDCETITAMNINYDNSISVFTLGGVTRLPCVEEDVVYSKNGAAAIFKALQEKWITYKLSNK